MREHHIGVQQPRDTPPHCQPPQDTSATGNLARSDSYSLTRGGKLVSSRPWAAHIGQVLVNMQVVDSQGRHSRGKSSVTSGASSSDSDSDSESDSDSDSDGTSEEDEDEYEVEIPLSSNSRPPHNHIHYTLTEEDEEDEDGKEEAVSSPGGEQVDGICSCSDDSAFDDSNRVVCGSVEDHKNLGLSLDRERRTSDKCEETDSDDGNNNESDDDSESESDETESTVRARLDVKTVVEGESDTKDQEVSEGSGEVQGGGDEEHNDTLSTLSGDLSFDDRDVISPGRENGGDLTGNSYPEFPTSPSPPLSPITTPINDTPNDVSDKGGSVVEVPRIQCPPEGERLSPQNEEVRAGVFCISGYPRPQSLYSQENPQSITHQIPSCEHPQEELSRGIDEDASTAPQSHHQHQQRQPQWAVFGRYSGGRSSRVAQLKGTGDNQQDARAPSAAQDAPPIPSHFPQTQSTIHPDTYTRPEPPKHETSHRSTTPTAAATAKRWNSPSPAELYVNLQSLASESRNSCHPQVHPQQQHQQQIQQEAQQQQLQQHLTNNFFYQQQLQQQQQLNQHLHFRRQRSYQQQQLNHPDSRQQQQHCSNTVVASNSSVRHHDSDGVCGGSGGRSPALSPAHPHSAATPTSPLPRLLTSGLSGSPSRVNNGGSYGNNGGLHAANTGTYGDNTGSSFGGGIASVRLGGSYTALGGSSASSGYGSCAGAPVTTTSRHEDSEDLSDVSSCGATSEDSARRRRRRSTQPPMKGEASVSGNEDFEWVRTSPMLTGLLEGHVTRLATPPDLRGHPLRASLTSPAESGEEGAGGSTHHHHHHHRTYPRPPPVPRPRTLEAGDLVPHRPLRDGGGLRDSRDGLRDRLYSPSRDLSGHRRSRDSSVERSGRDSSCERGSVSSLHQHSRHHHHHIAARLPHHACECPSCWCDDEEPGYDSCDDRHHHHRHSYHEGLHHAHLHQLGPHHVQPSGREGSRERRSRGQGSGDSGRSSPCCCRHCHQLGSLSSLTSHDYCNNARLALPCSGSTKGSSLEDRVNRLEGDKDSLQLQVTVLSEQVEAQTEKISDLENLLEEKKELLRKTEEHLQKEVMTRSSLETQRLELFSEISNLKLRQAAFERENLDLREKLRRSDQQSEHIKSQLANQLANSPSPSSISTLSTIPASSPNKSPAQPITASPTSSPVAPHEAREYLPPRTPPPNARRKIEQFGTMPRQRDAGETNQGATTTGRNKGVMFGKGLHFLPFRVAGKRSTSAPNLAETEMQMIDDVPEGEYGSPGDGIVPTAPSSPRGNALSSHRSPPTHHKTTGIKKIFTRLRRSSSGHLDSDLGDGDFRRGGMRATAAARLGWTSPTSIFKEPSEAFSGWSIDVMEAWLGLLGLSQYSAAVRSWSGAGHHLSRATPQHLERDLGIRHPLHRKKLQLALAARTSGEQVNTPLGRLDHSWVLRWLDDVGLPQYKDAFSEARIDGRVLNCLTYDDLAFLRLTNLLHVTSLKRGIQVLREYNFDPSVLKRRSVPEEGQRVRSAAEVALWTNHRVMEWLRTVDLSEYAPNLRGSGVHGALMVYEVRFTSELLASLLSIPCGKTLLRRHLNTHFKELVGLPVVQEKRELEAAPGYTALTTSAKVKMPKKSQFSLKRKKSKTELEFDDLLCPLDEKPPLGAIQDKEKEVRTGEVKDESVVVVVVEKETAEEVVEVETNGDGRLC